MVKLNITVNDGALIQLQNALAAMGAGSLPRTAKAVKSGAALVRDTWRGFAGGGTLAGIESLKRPSGGYARSIKIWKNGPFDYEIYSDAKVAKLIEEGTDELDMKTTHPYGPRSRVSKKGVPYLIIPFRWGTPKAIGFKNIIPEQIYKRLLTSRKHKFETSKTDVSADESDAKTPNAQTPSLMVGRAQYTWGDRVLGEDVFNLTEGREEDYHAEGMVRMEGQNRRSSGYFTFRIISKNSPQGSWIKPATPPRPVTRAIADVTRNTINEMVEGAVMEDLRNL